MVDVAQDTGVLLPGKGQGAALPLLAAICGRMSYQGKGEVSIPY